MAAITGEVQRQRFYSAGGVCEGLANRSKQYAAPTIATKAVCRESAKKVDAQKQKRNPVIIIVYIKIIEWSIVQAFLVIGHE